MQNIDAFKQLLSSPQRIVLTVHMNPDADALGSALGLAAVLLKKNHSVTVMSPNAYPDFLKWMAGNNDVVVFEKDKENGEKIVEEADIIFSMDYSSLKRVGDIAPLIEKSSAKKVIIDHHIEPENYADYMKWSTRAGATAELVFDLLGELEWRSLLNKDSGECLYAGIMTDTGGFKHPNTTQHIHEIVAKLIGLGVDSSRVSKLIYDNNTVNRIKLLGFALSERLTVLSEFNVAYISLSRKDLLSHNAQKGDTEGLVNYALSIKGIVMAAIFTEKDEMVKMSFRSIGSFSVNDFARKNFDGGGHMNAAGGVSKDLKLKDVVDKFVKLLPLYKEELNKGHEYLVEN